MGIAFIEFGHDLLDESDCKNMQAQTVKICRATFRAIAETMQEKNSCSDYRVGFLEAAMGIKYLAIDADRNALAFPTLATDFITSIAQLKRQGPPDYYPKEDIDLFYRELDLLETTFNSTRN